MEALFRADSCDDFAFSRSTRTSKDLESSPPLFCLGAVSSAMLKPKEDRNWALNPYCLTMEMTFSNVPRACSTSGLITIPSLFPLADDSISNVVVIFAAETLSSSSKRLLSLSLLSSSSISQRLFR